MAKIRACAVTALWLAAGCDAHEHAHDARQALDRTRSDESFVELVNTSRGSDSTVSYSHGNTFPAVAMPNGFNLWTPVTEANSRSWLYTHAADTMKGFAASHQPSPWLGDYGSFQLLPTAAGSSTRFEHTAEITQPHYYSVVFSESGLRTELSPSEHGAVFRLTYPSGADAQLRFGAIEEANGELHVDSEQRSVSGYVDQVKTRVYFHATIDHAITETEHKDGSAPKLVLSITTDDQPVLVRLATSFIGVEEARASLEREIGARSFDDVRADAQHAWDALLGRVTIEGASAAQRVTFYSSLYRVFLYPSSMTELKDGVTQHWSPYANEARPGALYVNNGFWDTYRAVWPLYTLLAPERAGRVLDGFLGAQRDGGWMPRWSAPGYTDCMVGTHSDIVLADAYLRGVRGFDLDVAYASMLKNALVYSSDASKGRKGGARSPFRGYIPLEDAPEAAAWYLEDRVNDFGIARVAAVRGDALYARYFDKRARTYGNLFSPSVGFFRGRHEDGSFRTSDDAFHANEWGYEFTEGAPWHYVAAANHDPAGLMQLYGGPEAFATKLDDMLAASPDSLKGSYSDVIHEMREAHDVGMGQYAHPNEPVHHMLYMYDYAGQPWKTQQHVREVLDEARNIYSAGLDDGRGYLGDEDNGQMSAWYIFSALGLYPASPGHAEYAIGSPLFASATVQLENGKSFTVRAPDNAPEHPYIQSASLNGRPYERALLSHEALMKGGVLELQMGASPSRWGAGTRVEMTSQPGDSAWDCVQGGSAIAQDSSQPAQLAFDDDSRTYWEAPAQSALLEYALPDGGTCQSTMYTLTSSASAPDADPQDWTLEGFAPDRGWTTLDQRSAQAFSERQQTRIFAIPNTAGLTRLRLHVTANHGATQTRIAELELLTG